MDRAEYWLLDTAVDTKYPLDWLVAEDIEIVFNRSGHGLTPNELLTLLTRLFAHGDLLAQLRIGPETFQPVEPTVEQITSALTGEFRMDYGLTVQGGARWEAYSAPDWSRYIDAGYFGDSLTGEVAAGTRRAAEQYLALEPFISSSSIVPNSVQWETLAPWQATYWKVLPEGHRATFRYVEDTTVRMHDPMRDEEWMRLLKWYTPYTPP